MTEKNELKCKYCGYDKYELKKTDSTFDEPIYDKFCKRCGRKFD